MFHSLLLEINPNQHYHTIIASAARIERRLIEQSLVVVLLQAREGKVWLRVLRIRVTARTLLALLRTIVRAVVAQHDGAIAAAFVTIRARVAALAIDHDAVAADGFAHARLAIVP